MQGIENSDNTTGLEIAVIGMDGRFPGAKNIGEFWENLKNGVESISFFGDKKLLEAGVPPEVLEEPDFITAFGFVEDRTLFDSSFFGYSPWEAELMLPQIRIFHECVWNALEDAAYVPGSFPGKIGLYAGGSASTDWEIRSVLSGKRDEVGAFTAQLYIDKDQLSTRISYNLNLRGPSLTVQTACSTSLVAIHLACQALLSGECDMALAGGITLFTSPKLGYHYIEGGIYSRDGHCRAYDAESSGTVDAEGVGVVVLKPLEDAAADNDNIYAVIKGSAINNDGHTKVGYAAPGAQGRASVVYDALQAAEVEPGTIGFIETHGIGTAIGDSIELEALKLVYGTGKKKSCLIGSVKTNIGHLISAAGIASFIKAVLAIKHRLIPPNLHFENPHPKIDFDNSPFYVNTTATPWESKGNGLPLRAGVSSFGIGGTNAHVILEEAPGGAGPVTQGREHRLLLLSAKTESALQKASQNLARYFKENPGVELADAAYTLQKGREVFDCRKSLTCSSVREAVDALLSKVPGKAGTFIYRGEKRPVIFIFPGMGAHYVNMARDLYRTESVFREEMDRCFDILTPLTGFDIKEVLYPPQTPHTLPPGSPPFDSPGIARPLMFTVQYSLAKLLMKWGIEPAAMAGLDIGEYTSACLSGDLSLEDSLTAAADVTGKGDRGEESGPFSDRLRQLLKENENPVLLEVGPCKALRNEGAHEFIPLLRDRGEDIPDDRFLLDKIGRLWLFGVAIDRAGFYHGERRCTVSLPTYPFEWWDFPIGDDPFKIAREMLAGGVEKSRAGKRKEISEWFYLPLWEKSIRFAPGPVGVPKPCKWLVFIDTHGVGAGLIEKLRRDGHRVIVVRTGAGFGEASDGEFVVHPGQDNDYNRLFEALRASGDEPRNILHLWSVEDTDNNNWDTGFYSLLNIAGAIGRAGITDEIQLGVVTDNMQDVLGIEALSPTKAVVLGAVNVIPAEYPNIRCCSMDIALPVSGRTGLDKKLRDHLLAEFETGFTDRVAAYRGNHRWVRIIKPVPFDNPPGEVIHPLKEEGVYLVTGGPGRVGLTLAGYLAKSVRARLVLTGRSPFPPRPRWEEWLSGHDRHNRISLKIRKLLEIEKWGGQVMVLGADVSNREQMQEVIAQTRERFGRINGVIHAAGVHGAGGPGGDDTPGSIREIAEKVFEPKVKGTLVLDDLLQDEPPDFFVLCSSLDSILPRLPRSGRAAYSAANAFLDAFAHYKTEKDGTLCVSINWDRWGDPGKVEVSHPLFDYRMETHSNETVYVGNLSAANWVLDEHRVLGKPTLPGTAAVEMARAAFEDHTGIQTVEIRDVYFLDPLRLGAEEKKEVQTVLKKAGDGFKFVIRSRLNPGEDNWVDHARGELWETEPGPVKTYDIETIIAERCNEEEVIVEKEMSESQREGDGFDFSLGPRWENVKRLNFSENEVLLLLELPEEFSGDIDLYKLHPALMDTAVGFYGRRNVVGEFSFPFYYKKLNIKAPISRRIYSYQRYEKKTREDERFLKYDITIVNDRGEEIVDIEEYKRLTLSDGAMARLSGDAPASVGHGAVPADGVNGETLPGEGLSPGEVVEVFRRILGRKLPQVVVSTHDFVDITDFTNFGRSDKTSGDTLLKPGIPEDPGAEKYRGPLRPRPPLNKPYIAPSNEVEEVIAGIWKNSLGIEPVGIDDDFFELGGDSLLANRTLTLLHRKTGLKISLVQLFETPRIRDLALFLNETGTGETIPPVEKKEYYPLSSAQKRLYIIQRIEPDGITYNMPTSITVEGKPEKEKLENCLKALIQRHESLRTSFFTIEGEPVQRIHETVEFTLRYHENDPDVQDIVGNFIRPFDLSRPSLSRIELVKIKEDEHILLIDMHHIITDATSAGIFIVELLDLYVGRHLPELRLQYKDFSQWHNKKRLSGEMKKQEAYWLNRFKGEIPPTDIPTDFSRQAEFSFEGDSVEFGIENEETAALIELAKREKTTMFIVIMALFNVFLYKITMREDIVVGTVTSGRRHSDTDNIMGFFINTLALRYHPSGEKTFPGFLNEVTKNTLDAFDNQDYQFEDLVEQVVVNRDTGRNPLFGTMFLLQNLDTRELDTPGLKVSPYEHESKISKFDLTLTGRQAEDKLSFTFEYCTELFKKTTIERFVGYYKKLISVVLDDSKKGIKISEIEIISEEEKRRLLFDFNDTAAGYPKDKTIHRLFEEQVEKTPDRIAVVGAAQLSYKELDEKSNRLAHVLIQKGVGPGAIVGIMVERSIDMLMGIFGILKSGAAYLPIESDYPRERIDYMLRDSAAGILLSGVSEVSDLIREIETIDLSSNLEKIPHQPTCPIHSNHFAYVIYTSGSTGKPKGVIIKHRSVVNLLSVLFEKYPLRETDRYLLKTSFVFDVSVTELFGWFRQGGGLVVLGEDDHKDPTKIVGAIECSRITHINFVPSAFNSFMEVLEQENTGRISSLKYIFLAGEALSPALVNRFRGQGSRVVLENLYGPTECTVYSSGYSLSHWDSKDKMSIGKPLQNIKLYILDEQGHLKPTGAVGELCISGAGVAVGYLNKPERTGEQFIQNPFAKGESLYRTGDLGRWLPDGNIEFLGRIDHQVKIRGFRIELGEIEERLTVYPGVKEAVAVCREDGNGDKYLSAFIVSEDDIPVNVFEKYLLNYLPPYMVPSYFSRLEKFPLTSNGKIDRKSLPATGIKTGEDFVAPRSALEEKLAGIWSGVLSLEKEQIGIDHNFFQLGGHSLKATVLLSRIHKAFNVNVPLTNIFRIPTIRGLAAYIKEAAADRYISIAPVEEKEYYTLSSAQKRLYVLHRMDEHAVGYNIPSILILEGEIRKDVLETAFLKLLHRHESFRTSFHMVDEKPVQRIRRRVEFEIEYCDSSANDREETRIKDFIRPFDLSRAPLLRVGLIKQGEARHILLVDMHHIISDGTSRTLLVKDFMDFYAGKELPEPGVRYKDFSEWQNSEKVKGSIKQQERYWLDEFKDEIPVLDIPTDFPRPPVQGFEGASVRFDLSPELTGRLGALALETGTTVYMVLLASYCVLLSKLSSREDIVIGSPVAGRGHADLEKIIGMFINTLALRTYPSGEKTFDDFLAEIKTKTLKAFENRDYPFEELVEQVDIARDISRSPLFDTMFVLQNMDTQEIDIPGLRLSPYPYENETSKFDLTLIGVQAEDKLSFTFGYSTGLFKKATIERFTGYYLRLLSAVLTGSKKDTWISGIEIISEEERERLLFDFNDTETGYPKDKTLHQLFEEQVERTPDRIALGGPLQLSYNALNESSSRLSGVLTQKSVRPGALAGIMAERSAALIVGILGILKCGAAYLPIDPDYPEERIDFMLRDTAAVVLLSNAGNAGELRAGIETVDLNVLDTPGRHTAPPAFTANSNCPAYVIYTSGSTGRPKGTMVEHRSVVNLAVSQATRFGIDERDRVLQFSSPCFDASVEQIFMTLCFGAVLVPVDKETLLDNGKFERFIAARSITHLHAVPSFLNSIELKEKYHLRRVLSGGDVCPPGLAGKWAGGCDFYNRYGPTETTVTSIEMLIEEANESLPRLPIGRPIANTFVYLFDKWMKLVPPGVLGELYIGGDGLCRGYLNRPELTAENFSRGAIPSPFTPYYRTGDLARWLPDGNLEFFGRIDHQVKIRGFRIELGEIESRLAEYPGIKDAVVICRKDETGDNYLSAYFVSDVDIPVSELNDHSLKYLPAYMVPSYFSRLERVPLTPNGKVDRKSLPAPEIKAGEDFVAPCSAVEEKLAGIWAGLLALEKDRIGIDGNFFRMGGHSLKATVLLSRIHKTLDVNIPLTEIFKTPTIRGLAAYIKKVAADKYISIEPAEKKEYYALSSAQKRLYVLHWMDEHSVGYNIPSISILEGEIRKDALETAFLKLLHRHESFRTSFHVVDETPVQRIRHRVEFEIEYYDSSAKDREETRIKDFIRPFDLSRAPLLRVGLIKQGETRHILLVDMHHIVSDGTSRPLLVKDFMDFYAGKDLPEPAVRYIDFSEWRNSETEKERIKQQEAFWVNEFEGEIPVSELPTDYPRPAVQGFEGNRLHFDLTPGLTGRLGALALETGTTIYMVILASYSVLLSKLGNREDIVIGSPTAGRGHADLEKVVGMFVNTLALRTYPSGEKTFTGFLSEVKEKVLTAFQNQDYQYEELVEQLVVNRDTGRNPLFDTMFVLQNVDIQEVDIPGLRLSPYPYENKTSKFDLTLIAVQAEDKLLFTFEYSTKLFRESTIERFIRYFKKIISAMLESTQQEISRVEIISEAEKNRVLYEFNKTGTEYPKNKTIHAIFAEQVEKHPDRVAVVFENQALSYGALDRRADGFASYLADKGAVPGMPVGIMSNPSVEMIVGVMAILKAGGAYLPIDPGFPAKRRQYMLDDSSAGILIAETPARDMSIRELEIIDAAKGSMFTGPLNPPPSRNIPHGTHLAYVIYTSGSTGNPRGVMIEHQNVINLVWGLKERIYRRYNHIQQLRVCLLAPYQFDASVKQIFASLLLGHRLYLVPGEIRVDGWNLLQYFKRHNIDISDGTPVHIRLLADNLASNPIDVPVKHFIIGGEALSQETVTRFFNRLGLKNKAVPRISNVYGPTECCVDSTCFDVTGENIETIGTVPIGRPMPNYQVYIVDGRNRLQPPGVAGELCVAGDGISRGYMNNPERTAERFYRSYKSYKTYTFYKTGDLARWLPDGNIEFLGRIDHQVKIRGFRIEPGEIERRLLEYGEIKDAVVLTGDDAAGDKYLVAYIVPGPGGESSGPVSPVSVPGLRDYLSTVLPGYMVPSYFVQLENIPLTANGKIDRRALPEPAGTTGESYTAPRDEIERKLADMWADALLLKTPVGIDDNFFELGGHSLKATTLISKIYSIFNVKVPLTEMFKRPTVRGLSQYIKGKAKVGYTLIEAAEKREYYRLSSAQKRLYFLQQMDPAGTAYNVPIFISLSEGASSEQLEETFKKLIIRHEGFRTSFHIIGNEPVQRIHDRVEFAAEHYSRPPGGDSQPGTNLIREFIRPFDLSLAPLLRVRFIKREAPQYLLFIDIHHIVFDGVSHNILVNDFMALWKGEGPRPLQVQYKDFARWQNDLKENVTIKEQRQYWLNVFSNEVPPLNLPGDFPGTAGYNFEGDVLDFTLGREETDKLKALASRENVTLYMLLFAAFGVLLAKLSGNRDIVIGCSTTGRMHPEFQGIIGMFVNTLAIRSYPGEQETFREYLLETKEKISEAFDNQDYQFEDLVDDLAIPREVGRNPLFDVLFALQNFSEEVKEPSLQAVSNLELDGYEYGDRRAKFDLMIVGIETKEGLIFKFSYRTKLFKKNTIERFTGYFGKIVSVISRAPGTKIADIDIVGEQERGRLINELREENVEFLENRDTDREHAKSMEADFDY